MVLTYMALRTGSILAPMLIHFLNNAFAVLVLNDRLPAFLMQALRLEELETRGLPVPVLAVAALGFVVGIAIIETTRKNRE